MSGARDYRMLTPHFARWEFTISDTAVRNGIVNEPSAEHWENLLALTETILEPVRLSCGPLHITSGYRSPELNGAIGGARGSQHMKGEAADLIPYKGRLPDVFKRIYASDLPFDQLIWEFGTWVHVSHVREGAQRRQALIASKLNGKTVYAPFTPEQLETL